MSWEQRGMVNSSGEQVSRKETGKDSIVAKSQKGQPTIFAICNMETTTTQTGH